MSDNKSIDWLHPICHYINGERLYYILLTVNTHVFKVGAAITEGLKRAKLLQSSCGYYLFGASDILLRVWGSEERILKFKAELTCIPEIGREPEILLISSMETWYQREVESKRTWCRALTADNFESLLNRRLPDELRFAQAMTAVAGPVKKLIRFFVFVRDDGGKNKRLMTNLRQKFKSPGEKLFNYKHKISLYSIYSQGFSGVLIKGETADFAKTAPRLVEFAQEQKDLNRFTTTYICSGSLKAEANSLVEPGDDQTPIEPRKTDILRSLLISEGCNEGIIQQAGARRKAANHFVLKLAPHLNEFFHFHEDWWAYTKDFRLLFKWCVMEDNDQLHAYLMRHYAKIEHELREMLWEAYAKDVIKDEQKHFQNHLKKAQHRIGNALTPFVSEGRSRQAELLLQIVDIVQDVFSREFLTIGQGKDVQTTDVECTVGRLLACDEDKRKQFTLGAISAYIKMLGARSGGKTGLIYLFAEALELCSTQRNLIAHGSLQNLTSPNQYATYFPWEEPVFNYVKMLLLRPRALPLIANILNKSAEL